MQREELAEISKNVTVTLLDSLLLEAEKDKLEGQIRSAQEQVGFGNSKMVVRASFEGGLRTGM